MGIRHVTNADGKGWLIVKYADGSVYPPLPQFLRVEWQKVEAGRDHFTILEGRPAGKSASVKLKADGQSYLAAGDPQQPPATVKFSRTTGELWYGDAGPVPAKTDPTNPIPTGTYDLEIPDEVHAIANQYLPVSSYATTWFRVGHSGDRYLHPGTVSAGCVTSTDLSKWTEIYNYLAKRRAGDGKSVGKISVIG